MSDPTWSGSRKVRAYNFTSSSATMSALAARAGKQLKRIALELGGYNPMIMLADADPPTTW